MSTIVPCAISATTLVTGPAVALPEGAAHPQTTVVVILALFMIGLTMRLFVRALRPVAELVRAAVAVVGVAVLLAALGAVLVLMLFM